MDYWNLPEGASLDPRAPWNQVEICLLCCKHFDDCDCPECPVCGEVGDPDCYVDHGLKLKPVK